MEGAAEQGIAKSQLLCGSIYAEEQNWTTAVKWWRKAAAAGQKVAQWYMGLCYYYGRGVDRDAAQAMLWFRKAAAQGDGAAAKAVQSAGIPGGPLRRMIVRFTNAGSAPLRHQVAHEFAGLIVNDMFIGPRLQAYNQLLQEDDSAAPHQSVRDSVWVDFMTTYGISEEELELVKHIHAYSQRTCRFCGSNWRWRETTPKA